jgi:hypothetical protein
MNATVRTAIAAFGIAAAIATPVAITGAGPDTNTPPTTPTVTRAMDTNSVRPVDVRLAGFDRVLADDDTCNGGSLQGSYYCYQQGGTQSGTPQSEYTPVQPPFGYNNLPQCSGGPLAAIAGVASGDGCT